MSMKKQLTNERLKAIMTDAVTYREANGDADAYTENGLYASVMSMTNLPEGASKVGMLEVMGCWYCKIQRYTPINPKDVLVYQRIWEKDKGWQPWHTLIASAGTALNSVGGGIIYYLPITSYLEEEGGRHEREHEAEHEAEGASGGHLAFGTLDAMCECVGRACEGGVDEDGDASRDKRQDAGCRRGGRARDISAAVERGECSERDFPRSYDCNEIRAKHLPASNHESRKGSCGIRSIVYKRIELDRLDGLAQLITDSHVAERKEVAA